MTKVLKRIFGLESETKVGKVFFYVLLGAYTLIMLYLFLMQCYEVPDFVSDMPAYIDKVAGIQGDYEFPYPVFFWTARVLSPLMGARAAVAVVTALYNSIGVLLAKYYMNREARSMLHYGQMSLGKKRALDMGVTFMVFALFLVSNLYSPKNTAFFGFDYAYRCMGIYTPNPFWNATYLATRPFTIVCFFEGVALLKGNSLSRTRAERGKGWAFLFALSLLLTTMTKPSFTFVFLPVFGLALLWQIVRSKGKEFGAVWQLCLWMIPTGLALLYQFFGVFSGTNTQGEASGIGFALGKVWSNYSFNIPLSILMGMALPLGVLVLNAKALLQNRLYRWTWLIYLCGMLEFLCFYEKGFRMLHANFSWGYMHGMFFVFLMTFVLILQNTVQWCRSWKAIFLLPEWGVFTYHLVCGCNFLWYALQGNELAGF